MAQLEVQPKKSNPWWIWLLLVIIILGLLFYFMRDRNGNSDMSNMGDSTTISSPNVVANGSDDWGMIDRNVPEIRYDEMTSSDVSVRGNDDYAIYSVDETILFDTDQSTIRPQAEENLQQIVGSAEKRFNGGEIRVYGYTDARGSAGYNEQLAQERAEAVKNWLTEKGNVDASRITVNAVGEAQPVASNDTEAGRQQNRRVEIVVRRG